jgi:hypothetical protein
MDKIPSWVWIVGGVLLLVMLASSRSSGAQATIIPTGPDTSAADAARAQGSYSLASTLISAASNFDLASLSVAAQNAHDAATLAASTDYNSTQKAIAAMAEELGIKQSQDAKETIWSNNNTASAIAQAQATRDAQITANNNATAAEINAKAQEQATKRSAWETAGGIIVGVAGVVSHLLPFL